MIWIETIGTWIVEQRTLRINTYLTIKFLSSSTQRLCHSINHLEMSSFNNRYLLTVLFVCLFVFLSPGNAYWLGDGYCDPTNNNAACNYDNGDCCAQSCVSRQYQCGVNVPYNCIDPRYYHAPTGSPTNQPTVSKKQLRTLFLLILILTLTLINDTITYKYS